MTLVQLGPRGISIVLRTVHLASFGILLGGHVFAVDANRLISTFYLTLASGIALMALEVYVNGLQWFFLGKGLSVLLKLAILLAVPLFWGYRVLLLLLVVVVASVGSHMPARYRHYSFLHGRVLQAGGGPGLHMPEGRVPDRL